MPRIEVRVPDDFKKAWVEFCKGCNESESVVLRNLIDSAVDNPLVEDSVEVCSEVGPCQILIRLSANDHFTVLEKVREEGYSNKTRWATSVILSALHRDPVLTNDEIQVLRESNRELAAIGRNLNQVSRKINIEFREGENLKKEAIDALSQRIEDHKNLVSDLLSRNMNRWN